MSPTRPWLSFERRGGMPPRDDEWLRVAADGSFSAQRTVGASRIGTFEGSLGARPLARLRAAIEPLAAAADLAIPTPHRGATEMLEAAGHVLRLGSNETPPKPWRAAIKVVREVLEDTVDASPRAALGLEATIDGACLVHAGSDPIDVSAASIRVLVNGLDDDGLVLGRWSGGPAAERIDDAAPTAPDWRTSTPGWHLDLPFEVPARARLINLRGAWLQVIVDLEVRHEGLARRGRLYVPVLLDG